MLLKYIKAIHEREQESDYDTAVDMTHYTFEKSEYFFETPKGVQLMISSIYESSYSTYMEPDFDDEHPELPTGGYDSSGLEYKVFKDKNSGRSKTNYHIEVIMPVKKIPLSIEQFQIYLENESTFIGYSSIDKEDLIKKYGKETCDILYQYHYTIDPDEYDGPNLEYPQCSKEDIIEFFNNLGEHKLKKGDSYEVNLPDNLKEQLEMLDLKSEDIIKTNLTVSEQNKINQQEAQKIVNSMIMSEEEFREEMKIAPDIPSSIMIYCSNKNEESIINQPEEKLEVEKESLGSKLINTVRKAFRR